MTWSSGDLNFIYSRTSSTNSLIVEVTDDGRSLMKSRNRGPRTVPWGTLDDTACG